MANVTSSKYQLITLSLILMISPILSALELDKWVNTIHNPPELKTAVMDEKISSNIELVFIYSSRCEYCKKFAPVFRSFVDSNKIKYSSITIDSGLLPGFEDAEYLPDVAKALDVSMYPTVLAINLISRNMITLSQGYTSFDELAANYLTVTDYLVRSAKL